MPIESTTQTYFNAILKGTLPPVSKHTTTREEDEIGWIPLATHLSFRVTREGSGVYFYAVLTDAPSIQYFGSAGEALSPEQSIIAAQLIALAK